MKYTSYSQGNKKICAGKKWREDGRRRGEKGKRGKRKEKEEGRGKKGKRGEMNQNLTTFIAFGDFGKFLNIYVEKGQVLTEFICRNPFNFELLKVYE